MTRSMGPKMPDRVWWFLRSRAPTGATKLDIARGLVCSHGAVHKYIAQLLAAGRVEKLPVKRRSSSSDVLATAYRAVLPQDRAGLSQ